MASGAQKRDAFFVRLASCHLRQCLQASQASQALPQEAKTFLGHGHGYARTRASGSPLCRISVLIFFFLPLTA